MKVNLFSSLDKDFLTLLNRAGVKVKINNVETKAFITNSLINDNYDDRFISTSVPLKRGDHIVYGNKEWYVLNQVSTKRSESYKAIIRCAEHRVRFNISTYDSSTSTYTSYEIYELPCLMELSSQFGLNDDRFVISAEGELQLTLQDNAITRGIYDSFVNATSKKHDVYIDGRQYEYTGFIFTDKGLVHINLSSTPRGKVDYDICWAPNSTYSTWNGEIYDCFYGEKIEIDIVDNDENNGSDDGGSGWGEW
ncbi:hypothetical protein MTP04_34320 [Lysinibacillus sp. PLM2]|nr:hypothetical protein MTP04_34320 [Lysinibacillus sp. PLM2]